MQYSGTRSQSSCRPSARGAHVGPRPCVHVGLPSRARGALRVAADVALRVGADVGCRPVTVTKQLEQLVLSALLEDLAGGDLTTEATIDAAGIAVANAVAKSELVVSGSDVFSMCFHAVHPGCRSNAWPRRASSCRRERCSCEPKGQPVRFSWRSAPHSIFSSTCRALPR